MAAWLPATPLVGSGQLEGDRVGWDQGNELIISETGHHLQRTLPLESDKPRVWILAASFCKSSNFSEPLFSHL